MEAILCNFCTQVNSEIVAFPALNPDLPIQFLCSACFAKIEIAGYAAYPVSCVSIRDNGVKPCQSELENRCRAIKTRLYEYQDRAKTEAAEVKLMYETVFARLVQELNSIQTRVIARIEEEEVLEVEHVNAIIADIREILDKGSIDRTTSYLISEFNTSNPVPMPIFMRTSEKLEEYINTASKFPEPEIVTSRNNGRSSGQEMRQGSMKRQAEERVVVMPIDTRNFLVTEVGEGRRKMVACHTGFPYRTNARWCRAEENLYVYTGGRYHGSSVKWCDFMDTSRINDADSFIIRQQGRDMLMPRRRHALICHDNTIYAFGGHLYDQNTMNPGCGIECLRLPHGNWNLGDQEWRFIGDMEEITDVTATTMRGYIYLAGNSRCIYKFDPGTYQMEKILIYRILDINSPVNIPAETGRVPDPSSPLPRQSSNTLIFAWETQLFLLQHDSLYYFSPSSDQATMVRKKLGLVQPWCSPFPVAIKETKGYFMLEAMETDLINPGEIWTFDFIRKNVVKNT